MTPNADSETLCEECGDAIAVTEALFNGVTRMRLCQPCCDWWRFHGLMEPSPNDGSEAQ
jgi:hypothetical protein